MKEKAMYIGLGIVLGIVFGSQIQRLPLVNKIPQV
jgi:hypothetical protein